MIRFGIAGFGLHAVKRLMPGFAKAHACRVTALSRRSGDQARLSAAEYGIRNAFDSLEALCQSPEVDAIFVTTPNSCHLADVLTAIRCRKPVLCEKPMGMNAAECKQMVEAARAAGVLLGIAQVFRFEDTVNRFRDRISQNQVGRPLFARSEFCFPGRAHARKWINDPAIAGGGPIADVGVHCIDALRFILQDEVAFVTARAQSDEESGGVECSAILTLEFVRGTLATVLVSTRADYRTPLEIIGESGILRADNALSVEQPIQLQLRRNNEVVESESLSNHLAYARQVDMFAAAVEGSAVFPVPGEEGWQNQEALDAAFRSVRSGRTEPVTRVPRG